MASEIIAMREIQRRYRQLINKAKRTKAPLYLGTRARSEAVLIDVDSFQDLQRRAERKKDISEILKTMEWIRRGGRARVNLARFIRRDRRAHIAHASGH